MNEFYDFYAGFSSEAIVVRLVFSTLLGGIIGLERATRHHPAGIRTFALVCLGSAASTVVNIYLGSFEGMRTDLSRIPAGVVSGIGFLGVGTIIITGKNQVRGLTTAASLWVTATLGIMLGAGMLNAGVVTFILIIITVLGVSKLSRMQEKYNRNIDMYLEVEKSKVRQIYDFINEQGYEIGSVEKKRDKTLQNSDIVMLLSLDIKRRQLHSEILAGFSKLDGVHYLEEV